MDYIVFGSGGHAKVVLDIIAASGGRTVGMMDDHRREKYWRGIPMLGGSQRAAEVAAEYAGACFIIAIGDNGTRRRIAGLLRLEGANFGTAVHPSAIIGSGVRIEPGTVVMPGAIVNADSAIGEHAILNTASTIDHDCRVGAFAHLSPGVHLAGGVDVGEASHIGIGASVLPGIVIGSDTIVGGGSLVNRDLPPKVTAAGCPARIIGNKSVR